MFKAAFETFKQILSPPFRAVMLRALGFTLALLLLLWIGVFFALDSLIDPASPALETVLDILTGLGLLVGLGFLIAPVTALFAGFYLDAIAAVVDKTHYPNDPPGQPMPFGASLLAAVRFTFLAIAVNILALLLLFLPGVNLVAFFVVNAYLLGREYYELAAFRYFTPAMSTMLRKRHSFTIFLHGLVITFVLAVPLLNLLTPLFATAFMVHAVKRFQAEARAR